MKGKFSSTLNQPLGPFPELRTKCVVTPKQKLRKKKISTQSNAPWYSW
jgi:hypothetical protein